MLNIANYQKNANQNPREVAPHTFQHDNLQNLQNNKCWEDVEKVELLYTVSGHYYI